MHFQSNAWFTLYDVGEKTLGSLIYEFQDACRQRYFKQLFFLNPTMLGLELPQRVRVFSPNPDYLRLFSGSHMVEVENWLLQMVSEHTYTNK